MATVSPARNPDSNYQAWGHSTVVGPWGDVKATTSHDPDLIVTEVDMTEVDGFREAVPLQQQVRTDLYDDVVWKNNTN